jgi:hypothetical protein
VAGMLGVGVPRKSKGVIVSSIENAVKLVGTVGHVGAPGVVVVVVCPDATNKVKQNAALRKLALIGVEILIGNLYRVDASFAEL